MGGGVEEEEEILKSQIPHELKLGAGGGEPCISFDMW